MPELMLGHGTRSKAPHDYHAGRYHGTCPACVRELLARQDRQLAEAVEARERWQLAERTEASMI